MLSCSIEPPPQYGQYLALLLVDIPITWNFILQLLHTNVVAIIMYRKVLSTLYYMHASRCQQNLLICSLLSHSHSTNKVKYDSTCIIYDEGSLCNNATSSQVHATFCNDCVRTSPTISYVIGIISIASISLIFIISASLVIQALALQPPPSNPTHRPTHVNKREVAICNISQGIL
jgi:hypothetical protein